MNGRWVGFCWIRSVVFVVMVVKGAYNPTILGLLQGKHLQPKNYSRYVTLCDRKVQHDDVRFEYL